jgi:glutathione reductase (NADPH)
LTAFDLFVIGGGSGGVRAARIAAQHGAKVALAEQDRIGGTCVIRGCVPKKLMAYASRFRDDFEDSVAFGWTPGEPRFDWQRFAADLDKEVARLNAAYISGLDKAGVTIFRERAFVDGPGRIRLASRDGIVEAKNILVATGGHPNVVAIPGAEYAVTSDAMFTLDRLPESIVIVGAGYVAIEFAGIMNGLGVKTTLLYRGPEILRSFDNDVRTEMHAAMERRGVEIIVNDSLAEIERHAGGLVARTKSGRSIDTDQVLLAIGRTPNTSGFGLAEAGVVLDDAGAIRVDEHSQSSVAGIYAIGDVTNRLNLTPVAIREGHTLADHLFAGSSKTVDHRNVPHAVFGNPEIGSVGLTEDEARDRYPALDIYIAKFPPMRPQFAGRGEDMLFKLVVDAESDLVLGCHILGPNAAEMIQLVAIPIKMRATKADFDATMPLHPTAAEELITMRRPTRRHRRAAAE